MNKFCKIIETEKNQVLIEKTFNHEEDKFSLIIKSDIDEVMFAVTAGYENEKERDQSFNDFDIKKANDFINGLKEMITEK